MPGSEEYQRRLDAGLCGACGVYPREGEGTRCRPCKDKQTARREDFLAAGKCPSHPERDVVTGRARCQECLDRYAEGRAKHYAKLKGEGKCVNHPERDALPGQTECQECVDNRAERAAEKYAESAVAGKCYSHPNRDVAPGYASCRECVIADRDRLYRKGLQERIEKSRERSTEITDEALSAFREALAQT